MPGQIDILIVAGARPNFMKIAPVLRAMESSRVLRGILIHTGQHHDDAMSGSFFRDLGIPEPEENLGVGGGSHAQQTAEIMRRFEPVLDRITPAAILVVGDVNSTLACALVAAKKKIPVIHVEAGLRSFDRSMPEEINRVLTDQISDFLFTTEREADKNLQIEGIAPEKIHFVGNVMVDSLEHHLDRAVPSEQTLKSLGIQPSAAGYALLTLHRPSNVDDENIFGGLTRALHEIGNKFPVIFPAHPRTIQAIERFSLDRYFDNKKISIVPPQPYLSMLGLVRDAKIVMTDSGGLQEETTALAVPCFTLRENTERWVTVNEGTNAMVGTSPEALLKAFGEFIAGKIKKGMRPELWDGNAARRIVAVLEKDLAG
ncbi:MAG: UDP-N-acetylglucosamine 2-epimerase (non-hydrolyzing) [Alphaproteobacteria bacterium]